MNPNTVRFVHRPIPDDARGDDPSQVREPLIDPDGIKPSPQAIGRHGGWFGAMVSWVFRVNRSRRPGEAPTGRKLDPQRWLPKE